jgi:Ca-activated chloride channel family protein
MFRFGNIEYLNFLIAIPVLLILLYYVFYSRRRAVKRYGNPEVLAELMPEASAGKSVLKYLLLLGALIFFVLGIARPQFGSKLREVKREGVEIIIALDVSNSMLAEDIAPNRLERAKQAISKLVDRLVNDRIGLIVFAGDAYVQVPITTDYVSVKLFLESISTQIVPKQGTAIGSAIEMGMKSFTPAENSSKALILITDGENHEDDAVQAARLAAEKGITVHTIGIGSPEGSPIPVYGPAGQKSYRKDRQGEIVISKLNAKMLQEIAAAGNGIYIRSTDSRVGLNAIFDEINKMEKQEMDAKIYSDFDERFQYMFGAGLILLLIEFLVLERKNRWLNHIKLFER